MSRCTFVVLCHHQPDLLEILLDRISAAPVALHVDERTPSAVRADLLAVGRRAGVEILPSRPTAWGSWGILDASMAGLRTLAGASTTHLALLTGQDLPLVPLRALDAFLEARVEESFLDHWPPSGDIWGPKGIRRFTWINLPVAGRRIRIPARRRLPNGMHAAGGSMQWCVSSAAAEHLVGEFDGNAQLRRFFRRVWIPDEAYVPTVLLNSSLAPTVQNQKLWFARWLSGQRHPEILTMADLEQLREAADDGGAQPGRFFARKFSLDVDSQLVAAIATVGGR